MGYPAGKILIPFPLYPKGISDLDVLREDSIRGEQGKMASEGYKFYLQEGDRTCIIVGESFTVI